MRAVVTLLAGLCVSVLLLGTTLLAVMGIAGVGLAWLVCQSIVAIVLLRFDSVAVAARGPWAVILPRTSVSWRRCGRCGGNASVAATAAPSRVPA